MLRLGPALNGQIFRSISARLTHNNKEMSSCFAEIPPDVRFMLQHTKSESQSSQVSQSIPSYWVIGLRG